MRREGFDFYLSLNFPKNKQENTITSISLTLNLKLSVYLVHPV